MKPPKQGSSTAGKAWWKQGLVLLASGIVLASSACYGWIVTGDFEYVNPLFAIGFFIGLLLMVLGVIWLFVYLLGYWRRN